MIWIEPRDKSTLAWKTDSISLKSKVNNLDVDKLNTLPADLNKLSNVVDRDVLEKTVHEKLVTKVNPIDNTIQSTSTLVFKTQYDPHKEGLEKKIESLTESYLKLVGWSRRLTTTMFTTTKIKNKTPMLLFSLLLLLLWIQKPQRLNNKSLILAGWSERLMLTSKLLKLKTKHHMPAILT